MLPLRQLLFEKGRVAKVLESIRKAGLPDPAADIEGALLYGHALLRYGDFQQALSVYSKIPPGTPQESERLWGLANAYRLTGNLKQVEPLVNEALAKNPPAWLCPKIYNTLASSYLDRNEFVQASTAVMKGIETALAGGSLTDQFILERTQAYIYANQGDLEEALFLSKRVVSLLKKQDNVLEAGNAMYILSYVLNALGESGEAWDTLKQTEKLFQESGSINALVTLRNMQGHLLEKEGHRDQAEQAYTEAFTLVQEIPSPFDEIALLRALAQIHFEKGSLNQALSLIRRALARIRETGITSQEDFSLASEGLFLVAAGSVEAGLARLEEARKLSESHGKSGHYACFTLYLAHGHQASGQAEAALRWLKESLTVAERYRFFALVGEKDLLIPLLLRHFPDLPLSEFTAELFVRLHHPALLQRLLRHSPRAKFLFLRSIKAYEARQFRPQLERLRNDHAPEVRRTARALVDHWRTHAGYRVYTFKSFRVFLDGRILTAKDWNRPGVKRLFLYFATHPEEQHSLDVLLETLWTEPEPRKTHKVFIAFFSYLRDVFEPWSRVARDYVFFESQRGAYGFFPQGRFWMDYQEFEKGIKQAEKDQLARNFKEARKAYREALNLYLGDYLEEFPYEDWLRPKRDYLRELYFRGVMRYAALERDSGNLPEARRVLEEALFKDLSRCDCITLLIQTLAQMKLSQQAKEWGERHITYIKKELREKPAPEVVEALGKLG